MKDVIGEHMDVSRGTVCGWMGRPRRIVSLTLLVLIVASYAHEILSSIPEYEWLHSHRPFYLAESIDKVGGAALCVLAVRLMYRTSLRRIGYALGLSAPVLPAIVFGLVTSLSN